MEGIIINIQSEQSEFPDISRCSNTKEKIVLFLDYIPEDTLETIYRFVKYVYFFK